MDDLTNGFRGPKQQDTRFGILGKGDAVPLDLRDPMGAQYDPEAIARGLSRQPRFSGQTEPFYCVAQHSVLVAQLVPEHLRLAALLHDAHEAFCGDWPSPIKWLIPELQDLEDRIKYSIYSHFGVPECQWESPEIRDADGQMYLRELRDVVPNSDDPYWNGGAKKAKGEVIHPWEPAFARAVFRRWLDRYRFANVSSG